MSLTALLADKSLKSKEKVQLMAQWLLTEELSLDEMLVFTEKQKAVNKAHCLEALEHATQNPAFTSNIFLLTLATQSLNDKENRIKWESAKIIGNIAAAFPHQLAASIPILLKQAQHPGTVVRWAAAYALGEILKLKTEGQSDLLVKIVALSENEVNQGVKKKYLEAIKKVSH
jgi:hypothetical protein